MRPPRRWPLHPPPSPLEALSSWLDRLARLYDLSVKDLLTHNLDLPGLAVPADLDVDPPAAPTTHRARRHERPDRSTDLVLVGGPGILDPHRPVGQAA